MSAGGILYKRFCAARPFPEFLSCLICKAHFAAFIPAPILCLLFARTQTTQPLWIRSWKKVAADVDFLSRLPQRVFSSSLMLCSLAWARKNSVSFPLFSKRKMNIYYFIRALVTRLFAPFCLSAWREKALEVSRQQTKVHALCEFPAAQCLFTR